MKKWVRIMPLLLLVSLLSACGGDKGKLFYDEERQKEPGDSYSFVNSESEITAQSADCKFSRFSGIYTVWEITSSAGAKTKLRISGSTKADKFKIIQVDDNKELTVLWEGGEEKELDLKLPQGKSLIKFVGNKGSGNVHMDLEPQTGMEVNVTDDMFEDDPLFND